VTSAAGETPTLVLEVMAFPRELVFELDRRLSGCNPALAL
jgi:hypothetical protein